MKHGTQARKSGECDRQTPLAQQQAGGVVGADSGRAARSPQREVILRVEADSTADASDVAPW